MKRKLSGMVLFSVVAMGLLTWRQASVAQDQVRTIEVKLNESGEVVTVAIQETKPAAAPKPEDEASPSDVVPPKPAAEAPAKSPVQSPEQAPALQAPAKSDPVAYAAAAPACCAPKTCCKPKFRLLRRCR